MIRVRAVETSRDGIVLKWQDPSGIGRQRTYRGRCTRRLIEEARSQLEDELNRVGSRLRWSEFRRKYETLHMEQELAPRSHEKVRTMLDRFEETVGVDIECSRINKSILLDVQASMAGLAPATIRSNMNTLWSVMNWGIDNDLLPPMKRPRQRRTKQTKQLQQKAKGRALSLEEIERMIAAVPHCTRPDEDDDCVVRAIHAMRLMGLRLDDAHRLSWDPSPGCHYLYLVGVRPILAICSEQKSGAVEEVPLTPPAVEWLRSLDRVGPWVCRLLGTKGYHATPNRLGRVIAAAGKRAGIVVKPTGGRGGKPKFASAHDLRRTFACYWLARLSAKEVQQLTRHADVTTLMTYYSDSSADGLAAKLNSGSSRFTNTPQTSPKMHCGESR